MDITEPHVWRACGWAAVALLAGVVAIGVIMALAPDSPRVYGYAGVIMTIACALLTLVRLVAPHAADLKQRLAVNLSMQEDVLAELEPDSHGTVLPFTPRRVEDDAGVIEAGVTPRRGRRSRHAARRDAS